MCHHFQPRTSFFWRSPYKQNNLPYFCTMTDMTIFHYTCIHFVDIWEWCCLHTHVTIITMMLKTTEPDQSLTSYSNYIYLYCDFIIAPRHGFFWGFPFKPDAHIQTFVLFFCLTKCKSSQSEEQIKTPGPIGQWKYLSIKTRRWGSGDRHSCLTVAYNSQA